MSVPWSAPEVVDGSWSGPASDVYSLAATVYSLLAGRSPFEADDGPNGVLDYAWRILHDDLRPTGRPDVPESLEGVLATAMARSPQGRYTSALSFARALQKVERELGLEVTNIDVLDNGFAPPDAPEGGGLSLHPVAPIDESLPTAAGLPTAAMSVSMTAVSEAGPGAALGDVPVDITLLMSPSAVAPPRPDAASPGADAPTRFEPPSAEGDARADEPPQDLDALLGLDDPSPAAVAPLASPVPPAKRPVWPAVLIDLTLLGAVAGAGAVYLLLLQQQ
jgi:hypothetical protein